MAKTITVYEADDLLTADQAADHFGYSRDYFRCMLQINDKAADARLIRLKIGTDESWRKANKSRAKYVFEYDALKAWYRQRQNRPTVKAKAERRTRTPSPVL